MGHSQAQKAENRERILVEAARQIREGGPDSVSVGALMQSVGLTHGGFYGHFASREDLIAEALERALIDGEATIRTASGHGPGRFAAIVRGYLSRTHRDSPRRGCAVAALASDVGRADKRLRAVMETHIDSYFDDVAEALADADETRAMVAMSAMIGAVAVSRVITDPARSDAVLRAMRDHLLALPDQAP